MASRPAVPPALALLIGVIAVSFGAIFLRLAGEDTPVLIKSLYRVGLATLVLLPFALKSARPEWKQLTRRDWLLVAVAGTFLAIHFITWVASLNHTTVASSVVLVTTNPLWVALLTPFVSTERVSAQTWAGILLSVGGSAVIGWGDFGTGAEALWGDALALMGALSAAGFLLIGRRVRQKLSLLAYVVPMYGTGALVLLVLALLQGLPLVGYDTMTYGWLIAVALVPQLIGHTSYNWALQWFSPSLIAVTLLGEPILSTLWAYLFLNESVAPSTFYGGALILVGVFFAVRGEQRSATPLQVVSESP
jgi:drug/metabolite transporter (DMT)-like permease